MGLITKEVEVGLKPQTIKYYEDLGYQIPRIKNSSGKLVVPAGSKILVKVEDLTKGSHAKVDIECDGCGINIKNVTWKRYLNSLHANNFYCSKCANNGFKKWISFEQWCIENNRKDVLDRWDYKLNKYSPSEITYGTTKKYYFNCPKGLHESELKTINAFTNGQEGSIYCKKCNSFAQWGIDNLGEDFLEKYWDYKLNIIDPWEISFGYAYKKVWIKCQKKDYHSSYDVWVSNFINNNSRCPYCHNYGKVHILDSLGKILEDKNLLYLWSDKNEKSPYEYAPFSNHYAYWKCKDNIHEDYYRMISNSHQYNFRCPECQYSKGEERINNYLLSNRFHKLTMEEEYNRLSFDTKNKNSYYIIQKTFDKLVGLGGGLLSYDFYLIKYNLLIEYQGEFHDIDQKGKYKRTKYLTDNLDKQVEHDRRKKDYALSNGYNFLEIWYYDFDNIEIILEEYLTSLKDVLPIS